MRNILIIETLLIQSSTIHTEIFREKYSIEYDSIKDNKKNKNDFFLDQKDPIYFDFLFKEIRQ